MKKHLSIILVIILAVSAGFAQKAKESKLEKNLREHVSYLASDELEGRKTGEKGGTAAAGYVSNMFQRFKLEPGVQGPDGRYGFLQSFEYISGVELGRNSSMSVNGKPVAVESGWMPIGFSPEASISGAKIVFAGYGITAAEENYDDYAGLDVKGALVLVFNGNPDSGNPHSAFGRFGLHAKANLAKQNGAAGLLVISGEEDFANEKLSLRYDQTLGDTAIPSIVISRKAAGSILAKDEAGLLEIEKWIGMRTETPENVRIKMSGLPKANADLTVDLDRNKAEAYNVVGVIPGRDPQLKNEIIVVGAHYDHLGRGGRGSLAPNSSEIHNGADDNASGTSSLLELAREFRKSKKNRRTLVFIAFGGEEEGLLGSKAYVNNPVFPVENTVAMVNMDMVGRLTNDKLTVGGIGTAGLWKDLVEGLNNGTEGLVAKNLPKIAAPANGNVNISNTSVSVETATLFDLQLNQDGFGPSDHSSFYGKKIPVLFFFTGTHSDYHKPSDDADKINYSGLAKINAFVGEIVKRLDARDQRPEYKVAQSAGMGAARSGFNVSLGTIPSYSDSNNDGLVIDGVRTDSPADKAGLKGGDRIIKLADKEIRNISDYMFVLGEMKAGEEYDVVVMRGEERIESKIVPVKR